MLEVIICLPFFCKANAAPLMAQLSDSLPEPVKYISPGSAAPMDFATLARASSNAFLFERPIEYIDDGLPYSCKIGLHSIKHFRFYICGCCMVKIYNLLLHIQSFPS